MDADTTPATETPTVLGEGRISRQQRYTAEDIAEALAALTANAGNVRATSLEIGIPAQTIRQWRDGAVSVPSPEVVRDKRAELKSGIERLARKTLRRNLKTVSDETIPLSLRDGAVVLGICVDKLQNLEAGPGGTATVTVNVNPVSVTITAADLAAARALVARSRRVLEISPETERPAPGGKPESGS